MIDVICFEINKRTGCKFVPCIDDDSIKSYRYSFISGVIPINIIMPQFDNLIINDIYISGKVGFRIFVINNMLEISVDIINHAFFESFDLCDPCSLDMAINFINGMKNKCIGLNHNQVL